MAEYGRKVRTLAGNFQLAALAPELLAPWSNPIFVQFVSHKIGRLIVPYLLVATFISNLLLASRPFYALTFSFQCAWYVAALTGHVLWMRDVSVPVAIAEERKKAA